MTPNWKRLEPPPALPEPYDGAWYWVQFEKMKAPRIVRYLKIEKWFDQTAIEVVGNPIAYQPYIEPEPYVEGES
jgi:hypothetical protein